MPEAHSRTLRTLTTIVLGSLFAITAPAPSHAKNHRWRFTEIFSNADGRIQFIEMQESAGSDDEVQLSQANISSDSATYVFPNDLVPPAGFRWVLIATQGFADLPGAPTPDYIIPNGFFDPAGDILRYVGVIDFVNLNTISVPTDGVHSIDLNLFTGAPSIIVNSPINFAGQTGSVVAPVAVPASSLRGWIVAAALLAGILPLARRHRERRHLS